jgi:rhodanese-related sulfurtransferase
MNTLLVRNFLIFSIFLFSIIACAHSEKKGDVGESRDASVTHLTAEQAREVLKDTTVFLLDIRTEAEFAEGHIDGAYLLPLQVLEARIAEISQYKNNQVLIYCRSGNRSKRGLEILQKNGFTRILHLQKGIISWLQAGYEIK